MNEVSLVLGVTLFILVVVTLRLLKKIDKLNQRIIEVERDAATKLKTSIATQRSVVKGQVSEQIYPFLDRRFNSSDMKFIGNPIDYIVFDGLSEEEDCVREIIFVEVKTGNARTNSHQRLIRECVEDKRVRWETIRLSEGEIKHVNHRRHVKPNSESSKTP